MKTFKVTYRLEDSGRHSVRIGAEDKDDARQRFKRLYKEASIVSVIASESESSEVKLGKFTPRRKV